MLNIDLLIDGKSVAIGDLAPALLPPRFARPGFFTNRMARSLASRMKSPCDEIYFAKNPRIELFADFETTIIGNDPEGKSSEDIYGTSAVLFLADGIITGAHLQLFESVSRGYYFSRSVRKAALKNIGAGFHSPLQVMRRFKSDRGGGQDAEYITWVDGESYLILQNVPANRNCHIHWALGAPPTNITKACSEAFSDDRAFGDNDLLGDWMGNAIDALKK